MPVARDLFGTPAPGPEGFAYAPELFGRAEERDFAARLESLPFKPFAFHGYLGNRRIVSFGYRYDYAGGTLRPSDPMPDFLVPLKEIAAGFSGIAAEKLQQALVTEYAPGAGIGWHRDKGVFADVVGFSFGASCLLRFRRKEEARWRRFSMTVKPRSAYLLRRAARHDWEHSIPPVDLLRYSVTFRSLGSQEDG